MKTVATPPQEKKSPQSLSTYCSSNIYAYNTGSSAVLYPRSNTSNEYYVHAYNCAQNFPSDVDTTFKMKSSIYVLMPVNQPNKGYSLETWLKESEERLKHWLKVMKHIGFKTSFIGNLTSSVGTVLQRELVKFNVQYKDAVSLPIFNLSAPLHLVKLDSKDYYNAYHMFAAFTTLRYYYNGNVSDIVKHTYMVKSYIPTLNYIYAFHIAHHCVGTTVFNRSNRTLYGSSNAIYKLTDSSKYLEPFKVRTNLYNAFSNPAVFKQFNGDKNLIPCYSTITCTESGHAGQGMTTPKYIQYLVQSKQKKTLLKIFKYDQPKKT